MRAARPAPYCSDVATARQRFFLVERYVPSISSSSVGSAVGRLPDSASSPARHLVSLLVSEEETCLSVFEAPDAAAVEAANEWARFQLDRIVEVELFPPPRSEKE
jgi:hypothetical protein